MKTKIKRLVSLLFVLFGLFTLSSCISSGSTLQFDKLPNSLYELVNSEFGSIGEDVSIKIDGTSYTLEQAKALGAIITGDTFSEEGTYTLVVKYNSATITFTYEVKENDQPEHITTWSGKGTESEPWLISTAEELLGMADVINGYVEGKSASEFADDFYKLSATEIDLQGLVWTPIGEGSRNDDCSTATAFRGSFNGNNCIIKNLSDKGYVPGKTKNYSRSSGELINFGYTYGLFGNLDGATIKNVTMEDIEISSNISVKVGSVTLSFTADSIGGIAGNTLDGGARCLIENCSVDGTINGYDAVAGIVGRAYGSCAFINCTNNSTITSSAKMGAITSIVSPGYINAPEKFVFINCNNTSDELSLVGKDGSDGSAKENNSYSIYYNCEGYVWRGGGGTANEMVYVYHGDADSNVVDINSNDCHTNNKYADYPNTNDFPNKFNKLSTQEDFLKVLSEVFGYDYEFIDGQLVEK